MRTLYSFNNFHIQHTAMLIIFIMLYYITGLPLLFSCKDPPANAGDVGLIPGSGRSLGGGPGSPLQYSYLGNLMDRGAWSATVHGTAKSWTQLNQLSMLSMLM